MKTTLRTIVYSLRRKRQARMLAYGDRYRGKRAFIIGNGPSLNQTDLSVLRDEITFGVNKIYLNYDRMVFEPTFYYAEDSSIIRNHKDEINARVIHSVKIFPYVYHELFGDSIYLNYSPYPPIPIARFSTDASRVVCWGGSCTYAVMQIAFSMGFTRLYLVGFDHNWLDLRKLGVHTHFEREYLQSGRKYNILRHMWIVDKAFRKARSVFEEAGREIVNCTPGGQLRIFRRQSLDSAVRDAK